MDDPHLLMKLSKMGARVVFHGVNGGRNQDMFCEQVIRLYHESNQHIRTMAARVWLVTVDNAAPHDLPTAAPGGVIAPDGTWAYQTPTAGDVPPLSVSLILTSNVGTFLGGTSIWAVAPLSDQPLTKGAQCAKNIELALSHCYPGPPSHPWASTRPHPLTWN